MVIIYNIDVEDFIEKLKSVMGEYKKVDFHYKESEKKISIVPRRESSRKLNPDNVNKKFPDIWDIM